jgi:antibiotic biosynthesis monooxygenase (ABM) superfamily enzyme
MALLTWAGAWTMITLILWLLGPLTDTWPLPLRTLVLSVLMVLALTWVVIPALTRMFAGWLAPAPAAARQGHRGRGARDRNYDTGAGSNRMRDPAHPKGARP